MKLVVEGDVRVMCTGDEAEDEGVMVGIAAAGVWRNLAEDIEANFGYGQEMNPRDYGPVRITIERM